MSDWNPQKYLEFKSERTQPSIDLISRINLANPASIIDIGCGPGNSTQILVNRWPDSSITGLDQSEEMIKKASHDYPDLNWIANDFYSQKFENKFDLVFSNAAIQWIPDHQRLIKKFRSLLTENGAIAVQIPQFWDMPLGKIIDAVSKDPRWIEKTKDVADLFTINDFHFYYDVLSEHFSAIEMWETEYLHPLKSHESMLEMMQSTGLKPYHDSLNSSSEIKEFDQKVLQGVMTAYPSQKNGNVILPFKRLFFIAYA